MFLSSTSLMERTKTPTWTERGEGEEELEPGDILFIISIFTCGDSRQVILYSVWLLLRGGAIFLYAP